MDECHAAHRYARNGILSFQRCKDGGMAWWVVRFSAQGERRRGLACRVVCGVGGRRPSGLRAALLASVALATAAHAQTDVSATWLANPASGDFNSASNWSGNAVPTGPTGTATFNASSQRDIGFSRDTLLGGISVTAGAGDYTFSNPLGLGVSVLGSGFGVVGGTSITFRNSGALVFDGSTAANSGLVKLVNDGVLQFSGGGSSGRAVIENNAGGSVSFRGSSVAGPGSILNLSGSVSFTDRATADSTNIILERSAFMDVTGSASLGTAGLTLNQSLVEFGQSATAGNATIFSHSSIIAVVGSASLDAAHLTLDRSQLEFFGSATAGNANIALNLSAIEVSKFASLGAARLTLDRSQLDISPLEALATTLGSLEGNGSVFLGNKLLEIGGNNLSTKFAGVIADGGITPGGHGALTKVGTGALTLTGQNTYTGATTVNGGVLVVDGSIASSSGVTVTAGGTLAGTGTVASTLIDGGTLVAGHNAAPFDALTV
jgi:autotransporter-associated beta strand protein